ncbi:MAG: thioredoxin family protein [Alistipes sp.]|nr:thioredoxin family protein [Alistipes sp.]
MTIEDFNTIISHDRLTLAVFYTQWCGPCKALHLILDRLEEMRPSAVVLMRFDVDNDENFALSQRYNIVSVPTMILFRAGKKLWRETGVLTVETLEQNIARFRK